MGLQRKGAPRGACGMCGASGFDVHGRCPLGHQAVDPQQAAAAWAQAQEAASAPAPAPEPAPVAPAAHIGDTGPIAPVVVLGMQPAPALGGFAVDDLDFGAALASASPARAPVAAAVDNVEPDLSHPYDDVLEWEDAGVTPAPAPPPSADSVIAELLAWDVPAPASSALDVGALPVPEPPASAPRAADSVDDVADAEAEHAANRRHGLVVGASFAAGLAAVSAVAVSLPSF